MTRLPGQSAIEGRLDQTTANKIAMIERMTTGGPSAINAAGSAYGQQMDAENQLGVQAANMRLNNQSILRDELGRMSQYENMKWAWDKKQPFEDTATAIEALREGGMRNKNAAFKDTLGSLANLSTMSWLRGGSDTPDWLSKLMSDGGAGGEGGYKIGLPQLGIKDPTLPATSSFNFNAPNVLDSKIFIK
jgi:hypothetical protein